MLVNAAIGYQSQQQQDEFPKTMKPETLNVTKKRRHRIHNEQFSNIKRNMLIEAYTRKSSRGRMIRPKTLDDWVLQDEEIDQLDKIFA